MLTESFGRATTENHSGRDKQVPAVKDCRFTQTAFGTVVHDSSGKWLGQYETEDAAVEMLREMTKDNGGYRNLTKEALAAELGISESTIKKYENGERALSITNLFKIIDYFKVDANTILNVAESKKETSIDSRLELMDCSKKAYFQKIFNEMLDNAEMLVS